jgi:hypothetical protein
MTLRFPNTVDPACLSGARVLGLGRDLRSGSPNEDVSSTESMSIVKH